MSKSKDHHTEMIKRFHSNLFYASDLEKTYEFYKKLGFDAQKSDDGVRLKLGDFTLAFIDENKTPIQDEAGKTPKGIGIFTYVEVDDADQHFEFIKKNGITPRTEPDPLSKVSSAAIRANFD